jgi:hypothetical protein
MLQQPQGWTVTTQRQDIRADDNGRLVRGVVVGFRLGSGTNGEVFVPEALFTPEYVRAAITAKASAHDAVSGLSG